MGKKIANFWADVTVEYEQNGKKEEHSFTRMDFDLAGVKKHCLGDVVQYYTIAGLKVTRFRIKHGEEETVLEVK